MSLASSACSAKLARASGPSGEPSHQSSARKPPDLPDAAQATPERSTTVTRTPRRARKYVIDAPMTPAPQTRTWARGLANSEGGLGPLPNLPRTQADRAKREI